MELTFPTVYPSEYLRHTSTLILFNPRLLLFYTFFGSFNSMTRNRLKFEFSIIDKVDATEDGQKYSLILCFSTSLNGFNNCVHHRGYILRRQNLVREVRHKGQKCY